ncbi:MAG: hypothetical protein ACFFAO_20765, partial [Candidatus Hermodarchaeota archaeon]
MSKSKKKEDLIELKGNKYFTLDRYIAPVIDRFSFKPTKDFARYTFGIFNDDEIFYYSINGEMCFTIKEFSKYLGMKYNSVLQAFKRNNLDLNKHYFKIDRTDSALSDKLSLDKKGDRKALFLTFLGVTKLLRSFRSEVAIEFYDWAMEKIYCIIKSNQLNTGQLFFMNKSRKIVHQVLGDKSKCFIDEQGFMYQSKGEMLIAKTLRELNSEFQYNVPISLPDWLINKLINDFPKTILIEANWHNIPSYITSDFLIRTEPRTVIEYWGLEYNNTYNAKREI